MLDSSTKRSLSVDGLSDDLSDPVAHARAFWGSGDRAHVPSPRLTMVFLAVVMQLITGMVPPSNMAIHGTLKTKTALGHWTKDFALRSERLA